MRKYEYKYSMYASSVEARTVMGRILQRKNGGIFPREISRRIKR